MDFVYCCYIDLCELQELSFADDALMYCSNAILEGLPNVTKVDLTKSSFCKVTCLMKKNSVSPTLLESFRHLRAGCTIVLV